MGISITNSPSSISISQTNSLTCVGTEDDPEMDVSGYVLDCTTDFFYEADPYIQAASFWQMTFDLSDPMPAANDTLLVVVYECEGTGSDSRLVSVADERLASPGNGAGCGPRAGRKGFPLISQISITSAPLPDQSGAVTVMGKGPERAKVIVFLTGLDATGKALAFSVATKANASGTWTAPFPANATLINPKALYAIAVRKHTRHWAGQKIISLPTP